MAVVVNGRGETRFPDCHHRTTYRLNAIRLLEALVAAGANSRAPMANTWVHNIALRDMSLQGTDLASAIAYAEGEGWLADSSRKGWVSLTRAGGVVAKVK
jgi:hypothetical protein